MLHLSGGASCGGGGDGVPDRRGRDGYGAPPWGTTRGNRSGLHQPSVAVQQLRQFTADGSVNLGKRTPAEIGAGGTQRLEVVQVVHSVGNNIISTEPFMDITTSTYVHLLYAQFRIYGIYIVRTTHTHLRKIYA